MAGEIISERRATSNRNGGRHHRGFAGHFPRNPHPSTTGAELRRLALSAYLELEVRQVDLARTFVTMGLAEAPDAQTPALNLHSLTPPPV
jgi:hypothetical protein